MHPRSGPRRRHSDELKAKVLAACDQPGASISGVALAHGLNTNLVRKWRSGRGAKLVGAAITAAATSTAPPAMSAAPEFVAIQMRALPKAATLAATGSTSATPAGDPLIHVELRRGPLHLNVRWPTSTADDCRAWLREICSNLLK